MCDDGDALNTVDVNVDLVVRPNLQDCYTLIHLGELENLLSSKNLSVLPFEVILCLQRGYKCFFLQN